MHYTLTNAHRKLKCRRGTWRSKNHIPSILLMTDEKRLANPEKAAESLPRGAGVIFRHYEDPNRIDIARRLQAICRRRGLLFIVGGDWTRPENSNRGSTWDCRSAACKRNAGRRRSSFPSISHKKSPEPKASRSIAMCFNRTPHTHSYCSSRRN
jgi:hypothetical protein